jgi:hypothetical protein
VSLRLYAVAFLSFGYGRSSRKLQPLDEHASIFSLVDYLGNYILNSQTVENRLNKVVDSRKGVRYYKGS